MPEAVSRLYRTSMASMAETSWCSNEGERKMHCPVSFMKRLKCMGIREHPRQNWWNTGVEICTSWMSRMRGEEVRLSTYILGRATGQALDMYPCQEWRFLEHPERLALWPLRKGSICIGTVDGCRRSSRRENEGGSSRHEPALGN
jgi:hypothetical protein